MAGNGSSPPRPDARLTRLDLHGFKSFATKTSFVFDSGITAVVGPNGSGKSNIADAIRWVLGETSYNALRSKRTEDVIFAGGRGKAPAGFAEVTVVFDNSSAWLPSEYTEVSVTRRAYRGGEGQYLINGRRVRLKDIAYLTASLGQSYTVVGQGLVDAALSQRPEDRRGLFEHAADLAGLRLKVTDAERNLTEAKANVERLTDLLTDVEPRLKTLERAARQAREWQDLRDRLQTIQMHHYQRVLRAATERFATTQQALRREQGTVAEVRASIDRLTAARTDVAAAITGARDALSTHDARLDVLREQARRLAHEREIIAARLGALPRRRADMQDTQRGLDEQVAGVEREQASLAAALTALEREHATARATQERLHQAVADARTAWSDREREANDLQRAISGTERALAELTQRHALLAQRLETGSAETGRLAEEAANRDQRIAAIERDIAAVDADDAAAATRAREIQDRLDAIAAEATRRQAGIDAIGGELAATAQALAEARNRLDFLQRLQESGQNLHAGARQVMQWHRDGVLDGVVGTIAELIDIDARYDAAIEVALGGRLQDIVVERWRHAEAAIGRLRDGRSGRATFQPLETVGRSGANRPPPAGLERQQGVHGIASDLVLTDDAVAPVIRSLLGRIVVVEDLPTSRRVLDALPNGWSAVTLAGEIARASGSVTGGAQVRESGVLGRERELRELPDAIARLERARDDIAARRTAAQAAGAALGTEQGELQAELAGLVAQQRERRIRRQRLDGWLADLRNQQANADRQRATAATARAGQDAELRRLAAAIADATATRDADRARHAALMQDIASHRDATTDDDTALAAASRDLAALEERLRAERRRAGGLAAQQRALAEERATRAERLAEVDGEQTALQGQYRRLSSELEQVEADLATAMTAREPLAAAVEEMTRRRDTTASELEAANQRLLAHERSLAQQELIVERARADHAAIGLRIVEDLAMDEPVALLDADAGEADPDDAALSDPTVAEREIARLKERLRRVGYVGDDVVAEYERESEHHAFLKAQLEDVNAASLSLRQMLADLHDTMRTRFEETFSKVAAAFTTSFTTLFGGGTARLVLTTDEESETGRGGVDIVAQPPGKRLQNLSLLSGGERSLTGVALLFAILKVSPSPFVLLDEVDAALDEANVLRFREQLRVLASETQAIVITHNRGTVEIADTLYGITMGGDGISQTLSLRLADIPLEDDITATMA